MKYKTKLILSIIANSLIFIFTAYAMTTYWFIGDALSWDTYGVGHIKFFTNLSNYFVGIASLILLVEEIKKLKDDSYNIFKWSYELKFIATISVTVTLLTVVFFLGPTIGFYLLWQGNCIFVHTLTPLLAIISTLFKSGIRCSSNSSLSTCITAL